MVVGFDRYTGGVWRNVFHADGDGAMTDIVERLRDLADVTKSHPYNWEGTRRLVGEAAAEIDRLRAIMHLQNDEIKMLRGRLRADAPFDAVEDYKQFRKDNPDTVTVDEALYRAKWEGEP